MAAEFVAAVAKTMPRSSWRVLCVMPHIFTKTAVVPVGDEAFKRCLAEAICNQSKPDTAAMHAYNTNWRRRREENEVRNCQVVLPPRCSTLQCNRQMAR